MPSRNISRRDALRQTFFYSAAAALSARLLPMEAEAAAPVPFLPGKQPLNFLLLGDYGTQVTSAATKPTKQADIAKAMQGYTLANRFRPEGMFLLGDNFYGRFDGGLQSPRWKTAFEEMYPANAFPGPCWAMLGNHDYNEEIGVKLEAELAYTRAKPGTRWMMPSKWYRVDYPTINPLVTVLVLDSNYKNNKQSLTEEEKAEQLAWLKAELAKGRTAPFLLCMAHHPLYSNGPHGDHKHLIKDWGALFQQANVDAYICGHDHDLQHLEFDGINTSFIVSGGGGAKATKMKKAGRGPYSDTVYGFTHLQVTPDFLVFRHIDENQKLIHAFSRTRDGKVTILATTPMKPIVPDSPSSSTGTAKKTPAEGEDNPNL